VLTTGLLHTSAQGGLGPAGFSENSATVDNVNVLSGLVTAASAGSSCRLEASSKVASTTILTGVVDGSPTPVNPAPNTVINVSGAKVTLNEQFDMGGPGDFSTTVNAIHVQVLPPRGSGDIIIGQSHCRVIGPNVTGPTTTSSSTSTSTTTPPTAICSSPPAATIVAQPGVVTAGTSGNDVIYGTPGDDKITGLGGDDVILGFGGNDQLFGADGEDTMCGGNGNDQMTGGAGNDLLSGDGGNDELSGDAGDDRLFGGTEADRLSGGSGTDICTPGGNAGDTATPPPGCDTIN
jgi:Ca2+-binding RTX toxin-like protein